MMILKSKYEKFQNHSTMQIYAMVVERKVSYHLLKSQK